MGTTWGGRGCRVGTILGVVGGVEWALSGGV